MTRPLACLAVFIAVAALGACGSDEDTPASPAVDPDEPVAAPDPDPNAPLTQEWQLVEARPGTVDPAPTSFVSAEPIDDGRTLAVRYWSGVEPCNVLDRVDVDETDDTVTITVWVGAGPDAAGTACIEIAVGYETRVSLDAPLGDRTVVDGALAAAP